MTARSHDAGSGHTPRDSGQLAMQVLEAAYDAYLSLDELGRIRAWNMRASALFGWSRDEVLGRDMADLIIPERRRDIHRRGVERFLATGEDRVLGRRRELVVLHRDGYEFLVEITIAAIETADGYTFHAFMRDITERRRAQGELALARDHALEASRMKSMFVANVSHEIRTPMNGVIGMTELLLGTELDDDQREYAETIASSGEALLEIIEDILDLSKIEAGKLEIETADYGLRDAVERACGMLAARAHGKGIELVVAIGPEVPALVQGDGARLRQVITNLVSNAIKFTGDGEVVVVVTSQPVHDGTARVRVEVSDTGIGITGEVLARLFTPFSQADGSTTREYGGTGLGLAISKQLVELMGGQIGATSAPGSGSRFSFELPLACVATDEPAPELDGLTAARVLVVDDNATARALLERQLSAYGMRVDVAGDGAAALRLMRSAARGDAPYALALLDQRMPGIDGETLAREIRRRPQLDGARLVLLTSEARSAVPVLQALDGALTKPVRESRLRDALRTIMVGESPAAAPDAMAARDLDVPLSDASVSVLVVEDGEVNQRVAARMLERCGIRAHIAENGRRALESLSERSYAAILMDCQMPELDGYETTREIRRRERDGRHIPIIAMTANSMDGERERCLAAGMDDYVSKPLRARVLREILDRWIDPSATDEAREPAASRPGLIAGSAEAILDPQVIGDLESLGGDLLARLLELYFEEVAPDMAELGGAIERGDALAVGRAAHRLRGTSATIGAARVARVASELEATSLASDAGGADRLLGELRRALDATRVAFDERTGQGPRAAGRDRRISSR